MQYENTTILQALVEAAKNSFRGVSFSPEKRGEHFIKECTELLNADIALIRSYGNDELAANAEISEYTERFKKYLNEWIHAKSRCLSCMITGPARFPVRRAEKANLSELKRGNELYSFRERALAAIKRKLTVKGDELEEQKNKLEELKAHQELMKKANSVLRSKTNIEERLRDLGFSEEQIKEILTPDFAGRKGFPAFKLTNNNANIKRVEERIQELTKKRELAESKGSIEIPFADGVLKIDYTLNRVQLLFNEKPDQETINKLKSKAFRWSPAYSAWQRIITNAAIYEAKNIVGLK